MMHGDYKFEHIGGTLDDAIGECYDKVARVLDLKYPGGPNVERLASVGKPSYILPKPIILLVNKLYKNHSPKHNKHITP